MISSNGIAAVILMVSGYDHLSFESVSVRHARRYRICRVADMIVEVCIHGGCTVFIVSSSLLDSLGIHICIVLRIRFYYTILTVYLVTS